MVYSAQYDGVDTVTKNTMAYTVRQLAKLAGVTVRTLHHYDAAWLLKPARVEKNGYRQYGEDELLRLQQILFFRELDFPLDEIRRILASPHFDMRTALRDHRKLVEIRKKRLTALIATIDRTIDKLTDQKPMADEELYENFMTDEEKAYAKEARERWGDSLPWKQSQKKMKRMTKTEMDQLKEDGTRFTKELATASEEGATSERMQALIAKHYDSLRMWYEPNLEMYRGLANMYVDDARFTKYYDDVKPGLAIIMRDAMLFWADAQEGKA